jgi:hypothetical protein
MGLFDTVHCEYPLPDARHQDLEFQTKALECALFHYTITRDGRLILHARQGRLGPVKDIEWPLHGDISIYTSVDKVWIEYVVRFTDGRVEWLRPREEVPPTPEVPPLSFDEFPLLLRKPKAEAEPRDSPPSAAPPADTGEAAKRDPEETLVQSLRRNRGELEKLLEQSSNHWGYEDPIYRFYHQSFKIYGLQAQTRSLVDRLQSLAPDLPLNSWFVQIVDEGTGKEFKSEDNALWPEVTRPILEAFFHARYFLEMAVRYANLEAPPRPLPSGYAALLELFGVR